LAGAWLRTGESGDRFTARGVRHSARGCGSATSGGAGVWGKRRRVLPERRVIVCSLSVYAKFMLVSHFQRIGLLWLVLAMTGASIL
jgi:hypothetical protein